MSQDKITVQTWMLAAGGLVLLNAGLGLGWAMARHAGKKAAVEPSAAETAPVAAPSMPDEQRSEALLKKLEKDDPEGVQSLARVLNSPLAVERLREKLPPPPPDRPAVSSDSR